MPNGLQQEKTPFDDYKVIQHFDLLSNKKNNKDGKMKILNGINISALSSRNVVTNIFNIELAYIRFYLFLEVKKNMKEESLTILKYKEKDLL